jgi:hypothetical protein
LDTKSVSLHHRGDNAFGGDPGGRLAGLVAELDAQDLLGAADVAVGLGQRLLAFHHRRIGLGAQFGHHACGNHGHFASPSGTRRARRSGARAIKTLL